jgi:hypothetical protein
MYLITFLLRFPIRLVVFLFVVSCYPFFYISPVTASCKGSPRFLFSFETIKNTTGSCVLCSRCRGPQKYSKSYGIFVRGT